MADHPPSGSYSPTDRERFAPEPPKSSTRGDFERDRARVLHSSALRRLGGKTQVVGAGHDDFARTRLTHSLEVAQVGRELATTLGCDPDVVDTACLAHDLGHPPFGHNGEALLAEVMAGHGGFEGNAQSLRLLTRLEPKIIRPDGSSVGLNLTRASIDASIKYPWPSGAVPGPKFGYYADDSPVVQWARGDEHGTRKCLEAQVMDLADDIAYSVHDVEDAIVGGWLNPAALDDPAVIDRVVAQAQDWYLAGSGTAEVAEALTRLRGLPLFVRGYDGSRRALAALKNMTSDLVGRFALAAADATRQRYGEGPLVRYQADLVVPTATRLEIGILKGLAAVFVMTRDARQGTYQAERDLLRRLVSGLRSRDGEGLEPAFAADYRSAVHESGRLRAVVDQVASLTDARARAWADVFG